jgi:hypothetical protein
MIDIEERLRRDAAQWHHDDHAPSLDDLLDALVAPPRSRRRLWFAVAAIAAVAVAGLVVVLAVLPRQSTTQPGEGSSTPPVERTRVVNVALIAVVGTPQSRTLELYTACPITQPSAVVRPSATDVHVRVDGYLDLPNHTGKNFGYQCTTQPVRLTIHLAAPLGTRTVSCPCAAPLPRLDPAELPLPTYLPTGYEPNGTEPINPASGRVIGQHDYRNGHDRLEVIVGADDQMPTATQRATAHVQISGHDASITTADGICVSWKVRPGVQEAVCAIGNPDTNLPTNEVVKVARSLP